MNINTNPYHAIKKYQQIPESLQKEIKNNKTSLVPESESLSKDNPQDTRENLHDAYIDNRLRAQKPITFLGFIDDLRKLWERAGKKGRIIRDTPITEEAKLPTITYRSKGRKINEEFKDLKPRRRSIIRHPYIEDEYIELYGQIFDVTVEFCVYSQTSEQADEIVIELEDFLQTYAGFFKKNGVQEILFKSQGEDEVIEQSRVNIAKRTLLYTIRFEKIITHFLNEIEQIAIQANILHAGEEQREDS